MLAPERNREHSIGDQMVTLNVGFMERLHFIQDIDALVDEGARSHYTGTVVVFADRNRRPPSLWIHPAVTVTSDFDNRSAVLISFQKLTPSYVGREIRAGSRIASMNRIVKKVIL